MRWEVGGGKGRQGRYLVTLMNVRRACLLVSLWHPMGADLGTWPCTAEGSDRVGVCLCLKTKCWMKLRRDSGGLVALARPAVIICDDY